VVQGDDDDADADPGALEYRGGEIEVLDDAGKDESRAERVQRGVGVPLAAQVAELQGGIGTKKDDAAEYPRRVVDGQVLHFTPECRCLSRNAAPLRSTGIQPLSEEYPIGVSMQVPFGIEPHGCPTARGDMVPELIYTRRHYQGLTTHDGITARIAG